MKEISTITANGKQLEIIYSMAHRGLAPLRPVPSDFSFSARLVVWNNLDNRIK